MTLRNQFFLLIENWNLRDIKSINIFAKQFLTFLIQQFGALYKHIFKCIFRRLSYQLIDSIYALFLPKCIFSNRFFLEYLTCVSYLHKTKICILCVHNFFLNHQLSKEKSHKIVLNKFWPLKWVRNMVI